MDYEFEDFTMSDMDDVLEYWQDVSQDPKFISNETGIELNKVIQILDTLERRGDISGFKKIERKMEGKILLFEDLNPETAKLLKLSQITKGTGNKDYFFDEKDINEVYDAHVFEIRTKKVYVSGDIIVFPITLTHKGQDYEMLLLYTSDDDVLYGSKDKDGVLEVRKALGDQNIEILNDTTLQIVNDHIPQDFWEVRNRQN